MQQAIARLEQRVASDAGDPAFAALAELQRRAGRSEDALRVAREGLGRSPDAPDGRAVLALVLLELGRVDELREQLAGWADAAVSTHVGEGAFGESVSEGELDAAFADAETDLEQVVDVNDVAQQAVFEAGLELPEDIAPTPRSSFATRTVAELLERQGDTRGASGIRAAIRQRDDAVDAPPDARAQTIAVLEDWLSKLDTLRKERA